MFTCFAEVDFEVERFARVTEVMFDFMPSSIEILEPGKISMDLGEASGLLNNISGRMHRYDEVARVAQFKIKQLSKQLEETGNKKAPAKKKVAKKAKTKKKTKK